MEALFFDLYTYQMRMASAREGEYIMRASRLFLQATWVGVGICFWISFRAMLFLDFRRPMRTIYLVVHCREKMAAKERRLKTFNRFMCLVLEKFFRKNSVKGKRCAEPMCVIHDPCGSVGLKLDANGGGCEFQS